MQFSVDGRDYALLKVHLQEETLYAESGAIVLIDKSLKVKTTSYGGVLKSLLRKLFAGESIFLLQIEGTGEVWLAPPLPGEIEAVQLNNECYIVQDYAYLAHTGDLKFSFVHNGLKSFLGTKLIWLKICGTGTLWVSGYGSLEWVEVNPNQMLDPLHFVTFRETEFQLKSVTKGFKNSLFDGEVDFLNFKEPTKVLLQSRVIPPLAEVVTRYTPQKAVKNLLLKRRPF